MLIVVSGEIPMDDLVAALTAGPPLELAMLFGSAAAGRMHAGSDVDIAIIPRQRDLPLADELSLQTELARVCGRDVDLVRLDLASTFVRWQVGRGGRPLVEAHPFAAKRFVAEAAAEYLDFAPAFERAMERFRARLALTGNR
jgi:predicted nucleotidyltransferase